MAALWDAHHRYQRDVVKRMVDDPGLAAWLSSFGYRDASFFAFGAFLACWQQDYWRPRRGMQRLADVLAECSREHGAKIRTRASVTEIVQADGRVAGVRLADGDELRAPLIVAACDHTHLERDLLGLRAKEPAVDDVSDAFFTVFLGLDWSDAELEQRLPEHHTFLIPVHREFRLDPADRLGHRHRWIHVSRCSRPGSTRRRRADESDRADNDPDGLGRSLG